MTRFAKGIRTGRLTGYGVLALITMFTSQILAPQQAAADACSINGRNCYIGYFSGLSDGGPGVRQHNVLSAPAMLNVNNVGQLVSNVGNHLGCGGGRVNGGQNGTGAAFIVLTMLGYPPGTPKNVACQAFGEWETTVRDWTRYTNYNVFYNFGGLNTRSSYNDVAYYPSAQTTAWSIVFYDRDTGRPLYAIKKDCANPVGRLQKLDRPKNYTLTPTVNSISPTESQSIEANGKMSVQTRVTTAGEVNSNPTQWEITLITVQPGKRAPHEDEGNVTFSDAAPCQAGGGGPLGNYFQNGDATCKNVSKGNRVFNLGSTALDANNIDIGDVPVGTRMCFTLSVQPRSNSDGRWAHAKPRCTVVGKKPKVQIWGGDVAVRGKIETSTSIKTIDGTAKTFGSWVEYGAFSVGTNSRFASGAGLVDQANNEQIAWSNLTFANKDEAGADAFGQYAPTLRTLPSIASFFGTIQNKQAVPGASVDIGSLTFTNGDPVVVRTAGDLLITGGTVPARHSVVIISTGTVTIDNSITYEDASITNARDIPQTVIIAQDINISGKAKQVDAWLVASGTINTCHDFTGNLTSGKCADRLEVNGPVVTNKLILNRTAGSNPGAESGDPGERFNLRPDAHLWALMQSRGSNKAQTVYSVELPPRF